MNRCFFISQNWNANVRALIGGLTLFCFLFMFPGLVEALQTALVRTSDGGVYQIRFRNKDPQRSGYDLGDFVQDFSIYDQSGRVKLCPGNDDEITWELYTAARFLAKTPRRTPLFDTSALVQALEQAVKDQDLAPTEIAKNLAVQEVVGHVTSGIQNHTFLKSLNIVPKSGPVAVIAIPVNLISKLGNIEIRMRKLLYAFWIASVHADTAIGLQKVANQKAAELWDAIERGQIVDIFGGSIKVSRGSAEVLGGISIEVPLRLRVAAQVYQENAERAAEMGADLGKSDNAWFSWLVGLSGIGDVLTLVASPVDALRLKNALKDLEASTADKIARFIKRDVEDIYDSASWDLDWQGFCSPQLKFASAYLDVYEGATLTYTVSLNSPPDSAATITISSNNSDATVSPNVLTFTPSDWYKPKVVTLRTATDTDNINDRVYLSHTSTGYGDGRIAEILFTIVDRKGNNFPVSVDTIPPLNLGLGDEFRLDLAKYFRDLENAKLDYWANSEDFDVVSALPDRSGSWITIKPRKVGSTRVIAGATDPGGLRVSQTFTVTVTAAGVNTAPTTINTISDQTLIVGNSLPSLNVSNHFDDPDGDLLTYAAWSKPTDIVKVIREGDQLTIVPINAGSTTITVSATDPEGLQILQHISVTVEVPPPPDIPTTEVPPTTDIPTTEVPTPPEIPTTEVPPSPEIPITEVPKNPDIPITEVPPTTDIPTTEVPPSPEIPITEVPKNPDIPITEVPLPPEIPITEVPTPPDIPTTEAPKNPDIPITEVPTPPDIPKTEVPKNPDIPITEVPTPPEIPTTEAPKNPDIPTTEVPTPPEIPITEVPTPPDIPTTEVPKNPDIPTTEVPTPPEIPITEVPTPPDIPTTEVPTPPEIPTTKVPTTPEIPKTEVPQPPDVSEVVPDVSEVIPDVSEVVPDVSEVVPDVSEVVPNLSGFTFIGGNTRPENVCDRTQQVLDVILAAMDVDDCANLDSKDLDSITTLVLNNTGITALQEKDFAGLSRLDNLDLHGNSLSSLSGGLFDDLRALKTLDLKENSLRSLPVDVFDELGSLRQLDLKDNDLIALPVGVFDGLKALESLNLKGNQLTTLPKRIFDNVLDTLKSDSLSLDDSLKTTFGFVTTTQNAVEGDTVRITVTLGHSLPVAIRVPYTIGGTARASDYRNLQPRGALLFLAGETSKEIAFTLLEDADRGAETVILTLGELGNVKVRRSDGWGRNAKLSAHTFLNPPQQRVHTTTVTLPEPREIAEDVNKDGIVNIIDLTIVASNFGKQGENAADINGDGVVNIIDLTLVAGAFGNTASAPGVWSRDLEIAPTRAEVEVWLREARRINLTDPTFQRGIRVLRQLLAALTPKETALLPNYPNPFNPETWIPYQLAAPADVSISIYAADGRLIRRLDLGYQAVGIYESRARAAYWDGKNALGEPAASGVYFYTLSTESTRDSVTAGEFTATRKMLIQK